MKVKITRTQLPADMLGNFPSSVGRPFVYQGYYRWGKENKCFMILGGMYVPGRRRPRLSAPHRTACARLTRPAGLASSPFALFIAGRDRLDLSSAPQNSYNSWELSSGGLKGHAGAGDVAAAAADGDVAAADDGDDEAGIETRHFLKTEARVDKERVQRVRAEESEREGGVSMRTRASACVRA